MTVAVDAAERIEAALRDVEALRRHGLVDARARASTARRRRATRQAHRLRRRRERATAAGVVAVVALRAHGVAGATVLLGVDGTVGGVRRRARLFGDNRDVPVMVVSVGETDRIAAALAELRGVESTLERVRSAAATARRSTPCPRPAADGRRSASTRRRPPASTMT